MKVCANIASEEKERTYDRRNSSRSDDYDDWDSRYMLRTDHDDFGDRYNEMWGQKGWLKPSCVPISIILVLIVLVVLLPLLDAADRRNSPLHSSFQAALCKQNCTFTLVESIPEGLMYTNSTINSRTTYTVWRDMIAGAKKSIEIASFYWTLHDGDVNSAYPATQEGEDIFNALLTAKDRGIKVKIVQSQPTKSLPNSETDILAKKGKVEVRSVNMARLVGSGVLHTKLWLVDREVLYVGSANTDWRSLTQVKELGLRISNCSCLLQDMAKIFDVYWAMGMENAQLPDKWPDSLRTEFNAQTPLITYVNHTQASVYISSSPPQFLPQGRTGDIDSILDTIHKAEKFIYIAVMDYIPQLIYTPKPQFWPIIDNALREVAIDHRVEVRLLISQWNYTRKAELYFLRSLAAISDAYKGVSVQVKLFVVPSDEVQKTIPHARVNHNKYMVTDNAAYIGTSNWSGDYFTWTAGVGVVVQGSSELRDALEAVFLRDWDSAHALPLPPPLRKA